MALSERIKTVAADLGFDLCGIVPAAPPSHGQAFREWLGHGFQGEMMWLSRNLETRLDPQRVLRGAQSAVVVGLSYFVENPPSELWNDPSRGRIARYAWGRDYHTVIHSLLKKLAAFIETEAGGKVQTRAFVDASPMFEKDLAENAALGRVGKNTLLITRAFGSFCFLGEVLVDIPLEADSPASDLPDCGPCRTCLDACPAGALVGPYTLNAGRCISYLTVEHKGDIPVELRPKLKNWIFGCDECQQVCPWTQRLSKSGRQRFLKYEPEHAAPKLETLMAMDEAAFRERFDGTAILRTGRQRLLRNAVVALGNWGTAEARAILEPTARDADPLIREHALWALRLTKDRDMLS